MDVKKFFSDLILLVYGKQNKGQEDIKAGVDGGFKSLSDQLEKNINQEDIKEIFSMISALSEKFDTQIMKLQSDLQKTFTKELQACKLFNWM